MLAMPVQELLPPPCTDAELINPMQLGQVISLLGMRPSYGFSDLINSQASRLSLRWFVCLPEAKAVVCSLIIQPFFCELSRVCSTRLITVK